MTDKEIADRIDAVLNEQEPYGTIDVERLQDLRDELRPPRPEPGAVAWYRQDDDHEWERALVHDSGEGLVFSNRQYLPFVNVYEYNPARILAPDEVTIHRKTAQAILGEYSYHNIGIGTVFATDARDDLRDAILARAEALRMEAER